MKTYRVPTAIQDAVSRWFPTRPEYWWVVYRKEYILKTISRYNENGNHRIKTLWRTMSRAKAYAMHKWLETVVENLEPITHAENRAEAWVDYNPQDPKEWEEKQYQAAS